MPLTQRQKAGVRIAVLTTVTLTVASWVFLSGYPPYGEAELDEIELQVEAARSQLTASRWHREPVFGTAASSSRDPLGLVHPTGEFEECFAAVRSSRLLLQGMLPGRLRYWVWDLPTEPSLSLSRGQYFDMGTPLYLRDSPPPELTQASAECSGLLEWIDELARDEDKCCPFAVDSPASPLVAYELRSLARALSILSRGFARDDDFQSALRLLVQGVAVVRDFRRGAVHPEWQEAVTSAEVELWQSIQNLVNQVESIDPGFLSLLDEEIAAMANYESNARDTFLGEAIALHDHLRTVPGRFEPRLRRAAVSELLAQIDSWCPQESSTFECLSSTPTPELWDDDVVDPLVQIFGPRVLRQQLVRRRLLVQYQRVSAHLEQSLQADLLPRLVRASLELLRHRQAGRCPDQVQLPAALTEVPHADSGIEVARFRGPYWVLTPPQLFHGPGSDAPKGMVFICPRAPGGTVVGM